MMRGTRAYQTQHLPTPLQPAMLASTTQQVLQKLLKCAASVPPWLVT
jgi:hypothetical protein